MEMVLIFTFCLILAGTDAVTTVTGYRGRSVQIKCNYTSGYEENNKYFCRGKCPTWDLKDVPVQSGSPVKDPRFSLYDETTAKVFTINITDLRPEDEGTYWCGIDREGQVPAMTTVSHTTHSTSSHSLSTSVHAESTHSTTGFPTSAINTAISVVLVLILFTLLFTFTLQRKKKMRVSSSGQPEQRFSALHMVPCPVYDYEETEDSRSLSNPLYSTDLPPLIPPEIYSNTGLNTVLSDSVEKSDESLMYATVCFDTRFIRLDPCKYDTVYV
ncbi:CMRF35-like molecule 2 [Clarias gariepinus]|uniref:CMRF35-like molecule 2 n=1 Tax=Clarias gariepinus TaxID=13013 RepID=UPI00234E1839|nr:CMRF35-like molecule 2 [Clarias gariepinus]